MSRRSIVVVVLLATALGIAGIDGQAAVSETPTAAEPPAISPKPSAKPPAAKTRIEPHASRGQLLYENHCTVCHTSVAHIRSDRRAKNVKDIETWVMRWAGERGLDWSAGDVSDVVQYLDATFYHFTPSGTEAK